MHSHNLNKNIKYTMKRVLLPLSSFPTPTKDSLFFHSFFMLIHENSNILYFLIFLHKSGIICTLFCNLLFSWNSNGNLFILVHRRFFILLIVARNYIDWI